MQKYMNVVKVKVEPNIRRSGQNDTFLKPDCYPEFPVLLTNLSFPKWPISLKHPSSNDSLLGGFFFPVAKYAPVPRRVVLGSSETLVSDFDEEDHPTAVTDVMKFFTPSLASVWIWPFLFIPRIALFLCGCGVMVKSQPLGCIWISVAWVREGTAWSLSPVIKLGLDNTFWVIWIRLARSLRCPQKPAGHA